MLEKNTTILFIRLGFLFFTAWKGTFISISYFGKQKPASHRTRQENVQTFKYKDMTSATQQHLKGRYPTEDIIHEAKRLLGNIGIVLKFQPFVHNAQSVFHKKWQAMSHDGDAWLFKPVVRGTGGEEAQSRRAGMWLMHANRVCLASNETRHIWSKDMTGYGWIRQNTGTWQTDCNMRSGIM